MAEHDGKMEVEGGDAKRPTLAEILLSGSEDLLRHVRKRPRGEGQQAEPDKLSVGDIEKELTKGFCIECEDQLATIVCEDCEDAFCDICFQTQHRKGQRTKHKAKRLAGAPTPPAESKLPSAAIPQPQAEKKASPEDKKEEGHAKDAKKDDDIDPPSRTDSKASRMHDSDEENNSDEDTGSGGRGLYSFWSRWYPKKRKQYKLPEGDDIPCGDWWSEKPGQDYFLDRARWCPVRLPLPHRKFMRLLQSALTVSEYTNRVDVPLPQKDQAKRTFLQLKEICAVLSGLVVATEPAVGKRLIETNDYKEHQGFFRDVLEIGRRHKIRNPEKMRSMYGKLIYMIQDSQGEDVQDLLEFSLVAPIQTVYRFLEERGVADLLKDKYLALATGEIMAEGKQRPEIDKAIRWKEQSIAYIAKKYETDKITEEEIRQCLLSIGDYHSYLRFNRDPCEKMLHYLTTLFDPKKIKQPYTLAIQAQEGGARLTHNHEMQFYYAQQTLSLWREILHNMYKLWMLAEDDLLDSKNPYELKTTGQGMNRVQQAPRTAKEMRNILFRCQKKLGAWVGSSVVHLGDNNVPNALNFIDKYNQIARILNPICTTLRLLPTLMDREEPAHYIKSAFGTVQDCKMVILTDFFRAAFDGSGADNFFAAGSCIDGRLTSAWNWCSQLPEKPFYPVFLMTGFVGFDGKYWGE